WRSRRRRSEAHHDALPETPRGSVPECARRRASPGCARSGGDRGPVGRAEASPPGFRREFHGTSTRTRPEKGRVGAAAATAAADRADAQPGAGSRGTQGPPGSFEYAPDLVAPAFEGVGRGGT